MAFLEYSVTRPFSNWYSITVAVLGAIWIVLITLVNVAAVGYENVTIITTAYNATEELWFEKFIPNRWRPTTWSCNPNILHLGDGIITNNSGFYNYGLEDYLDMREGTPENGMIYQNTNLQNCSIAMISLTQTDSEPSTDQLYISCNTSAAQAIALRGSRQQYNIPVGDRIARGARAIELLSSTDPLNISAVANVWYFVAAAVLEAFAPANENSFLSPSLLNNYSSISLVYDGSVTGQPNIIAGDKWTLDILYTSKDSISIIQSKYSITFLPTGEIDPTSSDLDAANELLAPSIAALRLVTEDHTFDVWRLINWVWVTYYWTLLYNFGEIAPTTYAYAPLPPGSDFTAFGSPNFSQPIQYSPTNNIFYNETLFQYYLDYMQNTLFPLYQRLGRYITLKSLPPFLPVQDSNRLQPIPVSIVMTYSCTATQLKGWISLLISVAVADWAFITGMYTFFVWIGSLGWLGHFGIKKDSDDPPGSESYCEGCVKLMKIYRYDDLDPRDSDIDKLIPKY